MPRLLTILPCEKVILSNGIPTLIELFENVNVELPKGQDISEMPRQAVTYMKWAVFFEWQFSDAEAAELKNVNQIVEIQMPDGTPAPIKGNIFFDLKKGGIYRNHQQVMGFPIGQEGPHQIRVWLEKDGKPITDVGTRIMRVEHKIPDGVQAQEILGVLPKQ